MALNIKHSTLSFLQCPSHSLLFETEDNYMYIQIADSLNDKNNGQKDVERDSLL